jgi:hypothetical protein
MVILTGKLAGFGGAGVVGFAHSFCQLFHYVKDIGGVGWGKCLLVFSILLLLDSNLLLVFNVFGPRGTGL